MVNCKDPLSALMFRQKAFLMQSKGKEIIRLIMSRFEPPIGQVVGLYIQRQQISLHLRMTGDNDKMYSLTTYAISFTVDKHVWPGTTILIVYYFYNRN